MVRLPREEIEYTKLYKNLDIDRKLNIKWPEIEEPAETVIVDENKEVEKTEPKIFLDEFDLKFSNENSISKEVLLEVLTLFYNDYNSMIYSKLENLEPYVSDSYCDICGEMDDCEENEIFTCSSCGIPVHQDCYGIPIKPKKFWFCNKCIFYDIDGKICCFCNRSNGIFKRTDDNQWAHAICCIIHPHLSFANLIYKDPIDTRCIRPMSGECGICRKDGEFLIRCSFKGCFKKYHTSCASEHLYCDLNNKITYCDEHGNFSTFRQNIRSKRKLLMNRNSYKELENEIFIREKRKLTEAVETNFVKLFREEISLNLKKYNVEIENEKLLLIYDYWLNKVKVFGVNFIDMFGYINFLTERSK